MTMTLSDLNYSYLELDIGGRVEEMRKDMNLYQKRWVLHFRYSCFLWFYGLIIYFWWWDGTIKAITETMMVMLLLKFRFRLWFFFVCISFYRQPFKFIPQSLHLQKTFTIDLYKGIYILESKLLLSDNRKAIHVLTFGFQPQQFQPYVCSSYPLFQICGFFFFQMMFMQEYFLLRQYLLYLNKHYSDYYKIIL